MLNYAKFRKLSANGEFENIWQEAVIVSVSTTCVAEKNNEISRAFDNQPATEPVTFRARLVTARIFR
jgi:hypothetical protein